MDTMLLTTIKEELSDSVKIQIQTLLHLEQVKATTFIQQKIVVNVIVTLCNLSITAFLETCVFSAFDKVAHDAWEYKSISESSDSAVNSSNIEMDVDIKHQSTATLMVQSTTVSSSSNNDNTSWKLEQGSFTSSFSSPDYTLANPH
ncbi:hypothetical protein RCL_jg14214.t1 [Rhizophagus clarus]|uniref:Uncharacterized protein n=1 Tax=Rhizophagus clarus TaxID=94130 RepID=A0A8H3LR41_9GLOM|nr:hypothetical protein RCL_jg14214.t1 [Rhizophagus clarus]